MQVPTPAATISPSQAISPKVSLTFTIVFTALYAFLFILIYVQLVFVLFYKHKRLSYQTILLFLCLMWAALRTTLFTFYYQNSKIHLSSFTYLLLYCFPVCLQFITLCLLVSYFVQVVFKSWARYDPTRYRKNKKIMKFCVALFIAIFVLLNSICAIIIHEEGSFKYTRKYSKTIVQIRVIISGFLFVICAIVLSCCIWRMIKTASSANMLLEAKGTSVCQANSICALIVILYVTKAIYNIVAINLPHLPSVGYGWINVSDQADGVDLEGSIYIFFGIILLVWEYIPTVAVVCFFRVRKSSPDKANSNLNPHISGSARTYFFDNPWRYDSEEDISYQNTPRNSEGTPSLSTLSVNTETNYGSTSFQDGSSSSQFYSTSTPPLIFTAGNTTTSNLQG